MTRTLITDDDKAIRDLLRFLLRDEGHEVHEAADGAEAVRACRERGFDLLLCDLFMPNQEGLETIRELRRRFPRLRIVAMSGAGVLKGTMDVLHTARLMGADAVLPKPFSREELLEATGQALAG